jgi:REP element-mobilizing transposase RayT
MARRLRFIPRESVVEVTCRTIQGRALLRPSAELNALVVGVLGRALDMYRDVRIHAFAFMSDHVHVLLSVPDALVLSQFMNHFNSNVAREAGRLHDWREGFWARRYTAIVVADEESQVARLRYVLAQGTKEGLVARPTEWPGANCARALAFGGRVFGTWIDRTKQSGAQKPGAETSQHTIRYEVPLTPLPCWRGLPPSQLHGRCRTMMSDIARAAAEQRQGKPPLGRAAILAMNPHERLAAVKLRPAPLVHAASEEVRVAFREEYRSFVAAFYSASEGLASGNAGDAFPLGSFPPRLPFRAVPAGQASAAA